MEELGRRFNARHPTVTVEAQVFDIDPRVEKILTAASADGLPDVLMVNRRDLPQYGPLSFLLPLGDLARRDKTADGQFYDAEIKACYDATRLLALPMVTGGDWQFIYYNRDLFRRMGLDPDKRPPRNWLELREQAARLTQRTGDTISQLGYSIHNEFAFQHFVSNWLALAGGTFLDKASKAALLDKPEAAAALEYLVDTTRALGGFEALNAFQRASGNPHPLPVGKLAMESRGTPWWFTFKQAQPGLDLGIMNTPAAPGKSSRYGAGDGWAYGLPRSSKVQEQAWRVLRFFTMEEDGAGAFVMDQLRPSPVKKLNENPEYKKQHPQWHVVLDMLGRNEAWVWLPVHDAIARELQPLLNEVRDGKTAPRTALAQMQAAAQRRVDEYWKGR
jgi:ABC-type glycerol-3-phosphate transport system substrate-binding protein